MTLIALALGLLLERIATTLLHLRELRWFDGYYDKALDAVAGKPPLELYGGLIVTIALPALPVLLLSLALQSEAILWDLAYLSFAVLIVFFCLGPRDLASEVDEFCEALDRGDRDAATRVLREMAEAKRPRASDIEVVEDAIFVQSNNRIFGVIFWFVVLGPVGAWIFRVSDLLRRRAVFEQMRDGQASEASLATSQEATFATSQEATFATSQEATLVAIEAIYGLLKWIPARLAMLGYALAGSFDGAMHAWSSKVVTPGLAIDQRNDVLIARVGRAAMTGLLSEPENSSAAARNSMRIVHRTVFIWVSVIAVLTLFGWAL
jgi:membrane protein required for beta-lactamase induction